MSTTHTCSLLVLIISLLGFGQTPDSSQTKKDSIVHVLPIPDAGSITPFDVSGGIISERQIVYTEYRSLYDILAAVPGLFVRNTASIGQQQQLVMNGIDGKNIAIFVDGIPFNDHYTGTVNLWLLPVDAVERIEVQSGTDAMFYDGKSGGGAINFVTKRFNNNRPITRLRYSQGVSGYAHTDAMFAQNIASGLNLSFALAHHGFGTNKESQNYRARFFNSNNDSWLFRSTVRYLATPWLNLTMKYSYDRTWTGLHGGVDYYRSPSLFDGLQAEVKNLEAYEKQYNSYYSFTASYFPFEDSTFLSTVTAYMFDRLREYRDEENRSGFRNSIFTKADFATLGKGMKLQFLSRYDNIRFLGYANLERIQTNDIATLGVRSDLFPEGFITISPFVTVKDYQSQFIANGGLTGTVRLLPTLSVFGGIAQNIIDDRSSSIVNTYWNFTYAQRTKEAFSNIEAGIQYRSDDIVNGSISVRRTVQRNPVVIDTVPPASSSFDFDYFYPKQYTYDAINASFHFRWNDFHAEGNASYLQQPLMKRNGIPVTLYPEIIANGSIYFHGLLAGGNLDLKIGLRGNYSSEQTGMTPYDRFGVWIPSTELTFGPSGTIDFFAIGKIGDAYVHFIWENLTGVQYFLAPVYPMYDSNIRFGLSWEFLD